MGDGLADGLVTALFKLRLWLISSRHVGDHDNRHAGILRPCQHLSTICYVSTISLVAPTHLKVVPQDSLRHGARRCSIDMAF
jgi:hypothetical protein